MTTLVAGLLFSGSASAQVTITGSGFDDAIILGRAPNAHRPVGGVIDPNCTTATFAGDPTCHLNCATMPDTLRACIRRGGVWSIEDHPCPGMTCTVLVEGLEGDDWVAPLFSPRGLGAVYDCDTSLTNDVLLPLEDPTGAAHGVELTVRGDSGIDMMHGTQNNDLLMSTDAFATPDFVGDFVCGYKGDDQLVSNDGPGGDILDGGVGFNDQCDSIASAAPPDQLVITTATVDGCESASGGSAIAIPFSNCGPNPPPYLNYWVPDPGVCP